MADEDGRGREENIYFGAEIEYIFEQNKKF